MGERLLVVMVVVTAACSTRTAAPRSDAGLDGGRDGGPDAGPRIVPDTCDPVTGAGCNCPEVGATRACTDVSGCPSVQECVVTTEFAKWSECAPAPSASETCTGGADEDCDALVDCADPDCAADPACDECPCRTGTRCAPLDDIICVPAEDYPCDTANGWYAICEPSGWTCMFTLPAIC